MNFTKTCGIMLRKFSSTKVKYFCVFYKHSIKTCEKKNYCVLWSSRKNNELEVTALNCIPLYFDFNSFAPQNEIVGKKNAW